MTKIVLFTSLDLAGGQSTRITMYGDSGGH